MPASSAHPVFVEAEPDERTPERRSRPVVDTATPIKPILTRNIPNDDGNTNFTNSPATFTPLQQRHRSRDDDGPKEGDFPEKSFFSPKLPPTAAASPFRLTRTPKRIAPTFKFNPAESPHEFYDAQEGDLYRGPAPESSPLAHINNQRRFRYDGQPIEEDAVSIGSSDSSSTDASVMSRGRRATMAVIERVGEAFGVNRRGSVSSVSSMSTTTTSNNPGRGRGRSRTWSWSSWAAQNENDEKDNLPPGRLRKGGAKREFALLLPLGTTPFNNQASGDVDITGISGTDKRIVRTPYLPLILDNLKELRKAPEPLSALTPSQLLGVATAQQPSPSSVPSGASTTSPVHRHRHRNSKPPSSSLNRRYRPPVIPLPLPNQSFSRPSVQSRNSKGLPLLTLSAPTPAGSGATTPKIPPPAAVRPWWLDVSCAGWEDMRAIGELLSLHPLTLEDILHQDPREKLEVFERLGYYLISFRAIDEGYFKWTDVGLDTTFDAHHISHSRRTGRRRGKVEIVEDRPGKEGLEGVGVGAVNVYLVVFKDGIISFHFDNISKHTKSVREKLFRLESEEGRTLSSDWIAHGIMDSIVDSFFPLIGFVEDEADEIDSLIIDPTAEPSKLSYTGSGEAVASNASPSSKPESLQEIPSKHSSISADDKKPNEEESFEMTDLKNPQKPPSTRRSVPPPITIHESNDIIVAPPPTTVMRIQQVIRRSSLNQGLQKMMVLLRLSINLEPTPSGKPKKLSFFGQQRESRKNMVKRMTETRRLITGLSRLLGPKHEVVGRLRKRSEDVAIALGEEMATHVGDVQDHIVTLQQALNHYENLLSSAHPSYISHLTLAQGAARHNLDNAILNLSVVSIGILPMQVIVGIFSQNAYIPHNGDREHLLPAPYYLFGIIWVAVGLTAIGVLLLVGYWKREARIKWSNKRDAR